jgi:Co/Zn/Cd efflux system component
MADPPVKLNINAKIVGLIALILAALGLLGYLVVIPAVLAIGSAQTVFGVPYATNQGILGVALAGLAVGCVASLLELVGGYRMYQENPEGKKLLIYGIVLGAVASVVYGIGYGGLGGVVVGLVVDFVVYYVVLISRFSNETPLVSHAATTPPPPPPPPLA